ncbi:MAG: hypothetical protein AAF266_10920 [Planctomycetota bacterium]
MITCLHGILATNLACFGLRAVHAMRLLLATLTFLRAIAPGAAHAQFNRDGDNRRFAIELQSIAGSFYQNGCYEQALTCYELSGLASREAGDLVLERASLNNRAWLLATATNSSVRNGDLALLLANKIHARPYSTLPTSSSQRAVYTGTLAAAHAESGDFKQAVQLQQSLLADQKDYARDKRLGIATTMLTLDHEQAGQARARLARYTKGRSLNEGPWMRVLRVPESLHRAAPKLVFAMSLAYTAECMQPLGDQQRTAAVESVRQAYACLLESPSRLERFKRDWYAAYGMDSREARRSFEDRVPRWMPVMPTKDYTDRAYRSMILREIDKIIPNTRKKLADQRVPESYRDLVYQYHLRGGNLRKVRESINEEVAKFTRTRSRANSGMSSDDKWILAVLVGGLALSSLANKASKSDGGGLTIEWVPLRDLMGDSGGSTPQRRASAATKPSSVASRPAKDRPSQQERRVPFRVRYPDGITIKNRTIKCTVGLRVIQAKTNSDGVCRIPLNYGTRRVKLEYNNPGRLLKREVSLPASYIDAGARNLAAKRPIDVTLDVNH